MTTPILGLHHVTATVDDAQADLDFMVGILGLRLVKKTVNFDNPFVYHFYYGDGPGTPGTIWTTFPYRGYGVRPGRIGAGQVTATTFSVPMGTLGDWRARLETRDVECTPLPRRFGQAGLLLRDPSGLAFELVETLEQRVPWTGGIDLEMAIRGLHSVTLTSRAASHTIAFMTDVLGFVREGTEEGRTRLTIGGPGAGHIFDVIDGHGRQPALNGLGTVHHVAMAIGTAAGQLEMRRRLVEAGVPVTPVQDRQYFQSIYFREPGGVLFEIATVEPGFDVDEPLDALGTSLRLPPWEEANRHTIETALPEVRPPS